MRFLPLCILACALGASWSAAVTVQPREDKQLLLHNPDMGWTLYENYPLDQRPGGSSTLLTVPHDDYTGVDNVALMFTWADIERVPDQYDFSKVDFAYDYWAKRGKQIQLRMSTASLLWWNNLNPPSGTGVPDYLLKALPQACKQKRNCEGIDYVTVDSRNALYRQRLEKFLGAVAKHFNSARPVTLIDLRGFGVWGEWHRGFRYPSLEARRDALSGILDRWSAAFPKHWLALSYSFDPDGSDHVPYENYVHFSDFDYAMTKANITFRRDGCGGAVRDNERCFADRAFRTLKKGPMSCEFANGYAVRKPAGAKAMRSAIDDALDLHPNYINLLGYQGPEARAFMREQPALFAYGLENMGYRLVPLSVDYRESIARGDVMKLTMIWANRGVGRAMRDFHLILSLADEQGKEVVSADAGTLPTSQWIRQREYEISDLTLQIPQAPPGHYMLCCALRDDKRAIELPLSGRRDDGSYSVGPITIRRAP